MADDALKQAFAHLRVLAKERDVSLHQSFLVELINYSRHEGVSDLKPDALATVITELGRIAMQEQSHGRVGGGAVRTSVAELCNDPFSECSEAAKRILGSQRGHDEISKSGV